MQTFRLANAYETLFWSLFGITQIKDVEIVEGHNSVERVGTMLFGAYHVAAIVVLINMLIAMMSNSFQEIQVKDMQKWAMFRCTMYIDDILLQWLTC